MSAGMPTGVAMVLWVNDYDKALSFYCEQILLFSLFANTSGSGMRNVVLND